MSSYEEARVNLTNTQLRILESPAKKDWHCIKNNKIKKKFQDKVLLATR